MIDRFRRVAGAQAVAHKMANSATSVGANYRAACTARSRAEFVAKLSIVNEEADETVYWLELARQADYASTDSIAPLLDEAVQLRAIFGRSVSTARQNSR